jgi:hypothetical protein
MFSSCGDKDSAFIFTSGRLPDITGHYHAGPVQIGGGTNALTCLPKHEEARENKFLVTLLMTNQLCYDYDE